MRYSYYQGVASEGSNRLVLIISAVLLACLAVFIAIAQSVGAASSTVTVTGDTSVGENQPGWLFNRDSTSDTPYEFNFDEPKLGVGSLYVQPIGGIVAKDKFVAENFINDRIVNIDSISFDFKIGDGGEGVDGANDTRQFYMNVYANFGVSADDKFYDCRYDVVATTGSKTSWSTVTFDPEKSYPFTQSSSRPDGSTCPPIPADMDDFSAESNIRMFSLNVGDTSLDDSDLDGYVDNVVISAGGDTTTYDFEPEVSISNKNDCKKGGWMTSNTPVFKNQGQCIASVTSNKNAN